MPRYHFHIVTGTDRESVGSMDLPDQGAVVPAGLKLTSQLLAGAAREKAGTEGWIVQATNDDGAVVYNFKVSPRTGEDKPTGYLH